MKSYLFVNPLSGKYSNGGFRSILSRLHSYGITPEIFRVHTPAEIAAICASIVCRSEQPLIIVAGGDGTFNAVVNGLEPGTAILAVIPFGTSNVLAAEVGITSIDDSLARIAAGKTRPLTLGVLDLQDRSYRFVLMAGIGLDGAVVRDVCPFGKKVLKQGAYLLSALKNGFAWNANCFDVGTADGYVRCHTAVICNASRYGGNFILSPECSPFLSGFSAVCIKDNRRRTYLKILLDLFGGNIRDYKYLTRFHVTTVEILGSHPIQVDGDFVGYGPAYISELRDFAKIIV